MNILVTGVTGFVGQNIAAGLIKHGHSVIGVSRQDNPEISLASENKFELITADLCSDDLCIKLPEDVNYVLNYAAQLPNSVEFRDYLRTNVLLAHRLFEYSKIISANFIHASTGSVYSWNGEKMIIDEDTIPVPYSEYGLSKYLADITLKSLCEHADICLRILRYPMIYGGASVNNYIGEIYRSALNDEAIEMTQETAERVIDIVHIDDVVETNISLINNFDNSINKDIFLVGSGTSLSVLEITRQIKKSVDSNSTVRVSSKSEESPPDIYWDISKLVERLQVRPSHDNFEPLYV
jgi:UDP-glucose 4-epimerase